MKVLFIGGNGNISWHCTRKAIDLGYDVYELHRGMTYSTRRKVHPEAKIIKCDIRNYEETKRTIADSAFDVVCDFICYNAEHARTAIDLFGGKTKQYIVISSDVVYKPTIKNLPFTENCEKNDPAISSSYISGKLYMEEEFEKAYRERNFPVTIVRPGYTYDTILPVSIGHNCYTAIDKIIKGKPLLIAGEGSNIWNFTNSRDFADGFAGLIGNSEAIGEAFDISTDEWLTWNDVSEMLLEALGVDKRNVFHVPFERASHLSELDPEDMMYHKMWHAIRSNKKIHSVVSGFKPSVSFEEGVRLSLDWLNEDPAHKRIVKKYGDIIDSLYEEYNLC